MENKRKRAKIEAVKKSEALERKRQELKKKKRENIIITALAIFLGISLIVVGLVFALGTDAFNWGNKQKFKVTHHATIEIEGYGSVKVELYGEEAPETVEAFVNLAESGYYNGLTFYGIQSSSNGINYIKGGKESNDVEPIYGEFKYNGFENDILQKRGIISLALFANDKSLPNKFFIIVSDSDRNAEIDGEFAAFGKVIKGMSVIDEIYDNAKPYDDEGSILPAKQPIIKSITIHESH